MAVAATGGGTGGASAGARPNAPRPGSGRDYGSGGVPGNDGGGQLPSHQFVDPFDDSEQQEVLGDGRDDGTMVSAAATGSGGGGRVPPPAAGANGERLATVAGVGGKGGGGRWLFVSHEPVVLQGKLDSEPNIVGALLGMDEPIFDGREGAPAVEMSDGESRLIHFKFEPMILHVLTASLHHAQRILSCGLQAGFRESGAINLLPSASASASATPIVAIRSMGLGLESLIGRETNGIKHCTVSGDYLTALIRIANERFAENAARIERFRRLLVDAFGAEAGAGFALTPTPAGGRRRTGVGEGGGSAWEDAAVRRERKRLEGLARAEEVRRAKLARKKDGDTDGDVDGVGDGVDVDV
ncbi:methyltransferase TYW3-domain-containing protein [Coniella lustricola]|uniref:tRNA(Phe) 7-[(3-amino-3-carboxypropyl)-4-demethylwyosine(37)-N(4)]-methyltransferase n=1 Tax=Coniella lustricola TaxID=2025994 RepID=A0A2T3A127_9PEZI|nr:methyltransferase TYW3-domain-containing protein [Coniella lustricola]